MKTMNDYYHLYLKCDVLLLADAFEKFGNNSLKNYGLRPSHYLGTLGLSWDATLKGYLHYKTILCHKVALDV